jgi:hypothetical protein
MRFVFRARFCPKEWTKRAKMLRAFLCIEARRNHQEGDSKFLLEEARTGSVASAFVSATARSKQKDARTAFVCSRAHGPCCCATAHARYLLNGAYIARNFSGRRPQEGGGAGAVKKKAMDGLHLPPAPAYGRQGVGQLVWTINYYRGQQIWWPVSPLKGRGGSMRRGVQAHAMRASPYLSARARATQTTHEHRASPSTPITCPATSRARRAPSASSCSGLAARCVFVCWFVPCVCVRCGTLSGRLSGGANIGPTHQLS